MSATSPADNQDATNDTPTMSSGSPSDPQTMQATKESVEESKEAMPIYVARKDALYVTKVEEFEDAWREFFVDDMDFAGIDCEYFAIDGNKEKKKVALLQLTGPRCTLLYHIARMGSDKYREQIGEYGEQDHRQMFVNG